MVFPAPILTNGPAMYGMRKYAGPPHPETKEEQERKCKEYKQAQIINGIVWSVICLGIIAFLIIAYWNDERVERVNTVITCICVIPACALPWLFAYMLLDLFENPD